MLSGATLTQARHKFGDDVVVISDRHWREFLSNYSNSKINEMVKDGMFGMPMNLSSYEKKKLVCFRFLKMLFRISWIAKGD